MVRISQIELFDFKNIDYGKIVFPKTSRFEGSCIGADVVGIYGQNGSGKTSVIEAIRLVQRLISGFSLSNDPKPLPIQDYFSPVKSSFSISVQFCIDSDTRRLPKRSLVSYLVTLSKSAESYWISHEKIDVKSLELEPKIFSKRKALFELNQDSPNTSPSLSPKGAWSHLLNVDSQLKMATFVAFGILQKDHMSPLFGLEMYKRLLSLETCDFNLFTADEPPADLSYKDIVYNQQSDAFKKAWNDVLAPLVRLHEQLHEFFTHRVKIFDTLINASCSLNILSMDFPDERFYANKGHLNVNLFEPALLTEADLTHVAPALDRVSSLIGALVPGLSLKMKEVGTQLLDDGDTLAKKIEFLSCRNSVEIPLRCESEGVRKLISLSLSLMEVHSYPEAFVAIDELDSGVFEYLLGELLSVIDSFGRGQLLFTAHNLRVLELLPTSDIVLTTSDPKNRFVKFKGSRPSNNLRDQYLRSVSLGGETSNLYMPTDKFSIDEALCLGGDEYGSV